MLDDSTDEACAIIDSKEAELQGRNINIKVVRRVARTGFKAGALQYGLPFCRGDLVAIFDADFMPDALFLKNLIPHFADPKVGMVQARWGHINREQNGLTRIQTYLLDTHFSIEQAGRYQAGYFINFCGAAGIWRKQCIEEVGGWDGNVLSEDLDLSYQAQLKGWKLVYDRETEVPAELLSVIEVFKIQQFRWTKGMAQISRKNMKQLLATSLPLGKKLHGVFHLLGRLVFVCLFLNAVFTVPLLIFRNLYPEIMELIRYTIITSINLIALPVFYYNGTLESHRHRKSSFFKHYLLFLVVYMGLSVQNALEVMQGFLGSRLVFVRTPKFVVSSTADNAYLNRRINWINMMELVILCYFIYGITLSVYYSDYFMMVFFLMIGYGLGFIIYQSLSIIWVKAVFQR